MRSLPRFLAIGGALLLSLAVAWWAVVFLRMIGNGYLSSLEAVTCSVQGSTICDLAMSLCGGTHPLGIKWYSPILLWLAVALLSAAAFVEPFRPERS